MRQQTESVIHTLWRTADRQCELIFAPVAGGRLRLWIDGHLIVDEDVRDLAAAVRRSDELKVSFGTAGNAAPHRSKSRGSANRDVKSSRSPQANP